MATTRKVFSKSLIRSKRIHTLPDDAHRWFYALLQLDMDNIGRTQGNKYYLKGKLYEKREDMTPDQCEAMLIKLHEANLIIRYSVGGIIYIQDPFHLNHNTITGNMAATSIYPPPSQEDISTWECRTGKKLSEYEHLLYRGDTPYIQRTNDVYPKDKDKGKDKGKDKDKHALFDFDLIWTMYPRRIGRRDAEKHFRATVKTQDDFETMQKALKNYIEYIKGKDPRYIQHGSTWFNNWRDWIDGHTTRATDSSKRRFW
jgi:hypothetical protein